MNFSYEEIFSIYGQYDKFVSLNFHWDSEAYRLYGASLMGVFKYPLEERKRLQQLLNTENIPRTNDYIQFEPSRLESLSHEQKVALDRKGIQNKDIASVISGNMPQQNRFIVKGGKDILNTIEVKFNPNSWDINRRRLGFYHSRLAGKYKLIPEEEFEYYGLMLFYYPDQAEALKEMITDPETGTIKEAIRYYQLKAQFLSAELSENENSEFKHLLHKRTEVKSVFLTEELQRSSERLTDIAVKYKDTLKALINICAQFEDELLLPYEIPIWWDFEQFLHIYVRHVKETKVGERFEDKTIFQYKFWDIERIVKAVIRSVYDEIRQEFAAKPDTNFRRMGKRSVYFDGNYYKVEIEPNGRLVSFHPYNDNEERENN